MSRKNTSTQYGGLSQYTNITWRYISGLYETVAMYSEHWVIVN